MELNLALVGGSCLDANARNATYFARNGAAEVAFSHNSFIVPVDEPVCPGAKVRGRIPAELWEHVAELDAGGGAVNSSLAVKLVAPHALLRYVDTSLPEDLVLRRLAYKGLETRFLGLRPAPRSLVLGDCHDKLIIKSAVQPGSRLEREHLNTLAWLTGHTDVFANSVKDPEVMAYLTRAAAEGRIRLHVVLTNSLPADFLCAAVLPVARVLYAGLDEVSCVVGKEVEQTIAGAAGVMAWLRPRAPQTVIYLTLGSQGVLVSEPGAGLVHVRLQPGPWEQIQRLVAVDATHLCGAGDAFAAGATAYLVGRCALLGGLEGACSAAVSAALAGCALAVRWVGWENPLAVSDFAVALVPAPAPSWLGIADEWIARLLEGRILYHPRHVEARWLTPQEPGKQRLQVVFNRARGERLKKTAKEKAAEAA